MNNKVDELVIKFIDKPYHLSMGAGKMSKRFKCSKEDIYEAKTIAKNRIKYGTDYDPKNITFESNSKGKLKSKWQNARGEWLYSYKFEDKDENTELFKKALLFEISNLGSLSTTNTTTVTSSGRLMEINLPDFHFGKIDGNTIEQQAQKFIDAGINLFNKAHSMDVEKILVPIGNDFFNSEVTGTTTKGTPQQNNAEFHKMFSIGWKAIIKLVNWLSGYAPVDIVIVPGNHDTNATIMLGEVLDAYYMNNVNVSVDGGQEQTKYYKFGKNFFMYNHGDKTKGNDLVVRMAVEKPQDFANTKYRFIKLGHFHKNIVLDETMGVSIEYMPSLCSSDKWHRDNHYLSQPKSYATIYDKKYGKHSVYNVYIENLE